MKQAIFGTQGAPFGGGLTFPIFGGLVDTHINHNRCPWPTAGVLRNLLVLDNTSGITWRLFKNEVGTALTCTTGLDFKGRDTTHAVSVVQGDLLYLQCTSHIMDTVQAYTNLEFEATAANVAAYTSPPRPNLSNYGGALGAGGGAGTTSPSGTQSLVAADGTITAIIATAYFGTLNAATGVRVEWYVNGVATGAFVNLMATTISAFVTAAAAASIPIVVGNIVEVRVTAIGAVSVQTTGWGTEVTGASNYYTVCGSTTSLVLPANTPYYGPFTTDFSRWKPVELSLPAPITPLELTGMQFINPALGAGKDLTLSLRKNGGDPPNQPTVTAIAPQTYVRDNNAAHRVGFVDGDVLITRSLSTTGATPAYHWSFAAREQGGTLTVIKATSPPTVELFDFSVTPDLVPAVFQLTDGGSVVYDYVLPGTYDVEETAVPANWSLTGYSVSNGSPHDAVTVAAGEDVVVTVMNTKSAIPGCPVGLPLSPITAPPGCAPELG